jgi:lipopolysaccharide export system protein LptC
LILDEKKRTVSTELPVTMIGPFFSVEGIGLFIDLQKQTLDVHSRVITTLNDKVVEK